MINTLFRVTGLIISIIILLVVGSLPFYWKDMHQINQDMRTGAKTMDSPYGTIEYIDIGEGKPILVSHGTMGGHDHGLILAKSLMGENYRFIIPSRFGYLQSDMPLNSSFEAQADSFAYVLEQLKINEAVIQGMSAGGVPATLFALRYPEKTSGLLLYSTITYAPKALVEPQSLPVPECVYKTLLTSDYLFWLLLKISPASVHSMVGVTKEIQIESSEDEQILLESVSRTFLPVSKRYDGWVNDGKHILTLQDMPLEMIQSPTLIVSAMDDYLAPNSWSVYIADRIPNSNLITYPTGGHLLLGHLSQIKDTTTKFIENCWTQ